MSIGFLPADYVKAIWAYREKIPRCHHHCCYGVEQLWGGPSFPSTASSRSRAVSRDTSESAKSSKSLQVTRGGAETELPFATFLVIHYHCEVTENMPKIG